MVGSIERATETSGATQQAACNDFELSGYAKEKYSSCGNRRAYENGLTGAFDDDIYNRKPEDIDVWDVESANFVVTSDPAAEISS